MQLLTSSRRRLIVALTSFLSVGPLLRAQDTAGQTAKSADRFAPFFQPFTTERAALSPDGKYLAFSVRDGQTLAVKMVEIDNPSTPTTSVVVASDKTSTPLLATTSEPTPAAIRWMRWVSGTRLVVETNQAFSEQADARWIKTTGAIFAFDYNGQNGRMIVSPADVKELTPPADWGPQSSFGNMRNPLPDDPRSGRRSTGGFQAFDTGLDVPSWVAAEEATHSFLGDNRVDADTGDTEGLLPMLGKIVKTSLTIPRSVQVFDLLPNDPNSILVRTANAQRYEVYKVNVNTAALHSEIMEIVPPEDAPLMDRQGRARVVIPATMQTSFPHYYAFAHQSGFSRWTRLDKVSGFGQPTFLLSPDNYLGERSIPLGFDEDPKILYFASNVGRDNYGIYSLNLKTGARGDLRIEDSNYDLVDGSLREFPSARNLVYDRFTRKLEGVRVNRQYRSAIWLSADLRSAQQELEAKLQGKSVEIQEWDARRNRFLVSVSGPGDEGGFYLYDREAARLTECVRRASWTPAIDTLVTRDFALENPNGGGIISGFLTLPRIARMQPVPVVVLCGNEPWERTNSNYNPYVRALADLGVAVVQINARGTWGFGKQQRAAIEAGFDRAQVADFGRALDYLFAQYRFLSPKHVGIMGTDRGGFLALRALQLDPQRFRCGIAVNPTVDLVEWMADARWRDQSAAPTLAKAFFGNPAQLAERPLQKHPEAIRSPACIFGYPGPQDQSSNLAYRQMKDLASDIRAHAVPVEFYDLNDDYSAGLPISRARIFEHVEEFLNAYLYGYKVDVRKATTDGS